MNNYQPVYRPTFKNGSLKIKDEALRKQLYSCNICPHRCAVNRNEDIKGICSTGEKAMVSSYNPHFGEEAPLVGNHGSGTIFLTHCNLLCSFCQNYEISHEGYGTEVTDVQLAYIMLELQQKGCHNINFVTPTHVLPQILSALIIAIEAGLRIPLVYNSGGYDKVETIRLLDGVFDIYMPDFKFWEDDLAISACHVKNYREVACKVIKEMHRQVGELIVNQNGIAERGLLIRHLVMPGHLDDTRKILKFIANEISPDTYVNIMPQYRPCGRAGEIDTINRPLSKSEYNEALQIAKEEGLSLLAS
ncbi:radical SAM protein [candidate division KSB1 bacterium]